MGDCIKQESYMKNEKMIVKTVLFNCQNGSYSRLYGEGEVDHINGVWPVFLTYS